MTAGYDGRQLDAALARAVAARKVHGPTSQAFKHAARRAGVHFHHLVAAEKRKLVAEAAGRRETPTP